VKSQVNELHAIEISDLEPSQVSPVILSAFIVERAGAGLAKSMV
jgi:predicted GNAT superfamily acetyltransferase